MAAVLIWLATFSVGLMLIVLAANMKMLAFQAFICAVISLNFVILAMREHERKVGSPGQQLSLMALNARYAGCNWVWMSLAVLVLHRNHPAEISGPMNFASAGLGAALLCLCVAHLIVRAAVSHPERIGNLLRISGFLAIVQMAGAIIILAVLVGSSIDQDTRFDWPCLNVIAFSAVALAIISARALVTLASGIDRPVLLAAPAQAAPQLRQRG